MYLRRGLSGLGFVPIALVRQALQNVGRDANIPPPFTPEEISWLSYDNPADPPAYWQRIRGSSIYGPGATGDYAWMNDPSQWSLSARGTEILNMNRDIVKYVPRFNDINWNDPRIRLPDDYLASQPVPELPTPPAAVSTVAPAVTTTQPDFSMTTTSGPLSPTYGGGGGTYIPAGGSPIYDPSALQWDESGAPKPVQAGIGFSLDALPQWAKIGLGVAAIVLAMPMIAPGFSPGRRRR